MEWQTRIASFKFSTSLLLSPLLQRITGTGATLNGTIIQRAFINLSFEWGTTTAYGNSTSTNSAGSGSTAVAESAPVSGLQGQLTISGLTAPT